MAKTGWKSTASQQPKPKNRGNQLIRSNASSKVSVGRRRRRDKDPVQKGAGGAGRSAETVRRLQLYSSRPVRNKKGTIVGGSFMMKDRAGDTEINASTGRIQPDRRWFGNTRTVDPKQLDTFREEMTAAVADPYSVVLRRQKLPMGLLQEAAEYASSKPKKAALLEQEPFERAFGAKSQRKRVKLDQLFCPRTEDDDVNDNDVNDNDDDPKKVKDSGMVKGEGQAQVVPTDTWRRSNKRAKIDHQEEEDKNEDSSDTKIKAATLEPTQDDDGDDDEENDDSAGYKALLAVAQKSQSAYHTVNHREGMVPWGRDRDVVRTEGEGIDWRTLKKDDLFLKGQSKRIWGEFFKVVDCSDVILHVIDARNVPGTRCTMIEHHIRQHASHKHLVFILNKIDLVPNWVAKRWMGELAKDRPTIAFHASMTHAFGKGALISLLRQFGQLHADKKQISVGVIGYPNVGKSSVINTLLSKKSCKVAPIPGETKIWQYVTLFKRIALIDCPGVVVDTAGDTETDSVLKGVVRAERLEHPHEFIPAILEKVAAEHIIAQYGLDKNQDKPHEWMENADILLERIARKFGRLRKGGDPCLRSAAIMMILDYQRGRLPHYVPPPELKTTTTATASKKKDNVPHVTQDLDAIGSEHMIKQQQQQQEAQEDKEQNEDGSSKISVAHVADTKLEAKEEKGAGKTAFTSGIPGKKKKAE